MSLSPSPLRVAALVDLPRSAASGGHVKCWERIAAAAADSPLPLDLTVYFSGVLPTEVLGPKARLCHLPPVFSTSRLKFLPYVPDHTDLSPWHPALARELKKYDVLHTTDGYFAFARTAERLSRTKKTPLVTSFHTDTPSYARLFTKQTLERLCRPSWLTRLLIEGLQLPERQGRKMERRLCEHVRHCRAALVTRVEDHTLAESILGPAKTHHLRLGVDRALFGPHRLDRTGIEATYGIKAGRVVLLFVGRLDVGKNIYTLIESMERLLAEGVPLHLVTAGLGPAADDLRQRLGDRVTVAGFVAPSDLARLYASVDGLAMTSEVEIRSMAGVEAITSGCPALVAAKSGVVELFDHTPAMLEISGGVDPWTEALRLFSSTPSLRTVMRATALDYSQKRIASWHDVLAEDLFPVWQEAAKKGM